MEDAGNEGIAHFQGTFFNQNRGNDSPSLINF